MWASRAPLLNGAALGARSKKDEGSAHKGTLMRQVGRSIVSAKSALSAPCPNVSEATDWMEQRRIDRPLRTSQSDTLCTARVALVKPEKNKQT